MPTKIEKDTVTGHETTGHEWDGLKELNTPLPKWWLYVFFATIVWAVGLCVLYPSVPGITGYFHGLLGYSSATPVDADVRPVAQQRAGVDGQDRRAVVRRDPQGSRSCMRSRRPAGASPSPTTASPATARAAAAARLSRRWPPMTGSGAASSTNPADHHLRHPQRAIPMRAHSADAALRRRRHPEARGDPPSPITC